MVYLWVLVLKWYREEERKKSNVHVSVCLFVHVRVNAHVSLINTVNMHELHCAIYTCEQYLDMQYVRHLRIEHVALMAIVNGTLFILHIILFVCACVCVSPP